MQKVNVFIILEKNRDVAAASFWEKDGIAKFLNLLESFLGAIFVHSIFIISVIYILTSVLRLKLFKN